MSACKENRKMQQITIKLKVEDLNRLGSMQIQRVTTLVTYIREAVSEFLDNHYK